MRLYASRANTVITPLQDVLGLGGAARMNRPGVARGNWTWRVHRSALSDSIAAVLEPLAVETDRA